MRSKKYVPKAVEDFEQAAKDFGCMVTGALYPDFHHIIGREQPRKINLVSEKAGQWFGIPVCREVHDMLGTPAGRRELSLDLYDEVFEERYMLESKMFNRFSSLIFAGNYIPWHIHSYLLNFIENEKRG